MENPNFIENETELIDYLNVIWKRKWLIFIPTFALIFIAGIISFLSPPQWKVDAIIVPCKFLIQTEQGEFREVVIVDPKQIAGQINQESYNHLIASELNLDIRKFPKLKAENVRDTKLVQVSLKDNDVERAKKILFSLFNYLKRDLDKKIDVEIKGIDSQVMANENLIKLKELIIKDKLSEIKLNQIEKNKTREEILSAEKKLKISEERVKNIIDEMKAVKERIDGLEEQQRKALAEKIQGIDAISLLLYSNTVQENLRYYNTLDEKLSDEKITQENLNLLMKEKNEEIKKLDTEIEKLKNEIDKINNEIENVKNQISLLNEKKGRIDYTQLIKEPTSSITPVSPKKKQNVMIAGVLGLMIFTILAFFLEYIKTQKAKGNGR
jgi:capsular polysaccharide biosynthesis protein